MRHENYLRLAEAQAAKSRYERWPVGAVLVRGGRVLAASPNLTRNYAGLAGVPWEECSIHAEMAVLRRVSPRRGGTMYVARLRRTGVRGMARPCERCEKELTEFGVRRMVWTIDERSFGTTMLQQDSSTNDLTKLLESALL